MSRYDIFLFGHILAVIAWVGSGFLLQVLAVLTGRAKDDATFARLWQYTAMLGPRLFMPASLATLVFGLALAGDGPWSFGSLWIVLALVGFAATFATGMFVIKPGADRIAARIERNGGTMGPGEVGDARTLIVLSRIDYVVLLLVIFDMVVKPTGDDTGALVLMALLLAAGTAWTLSRARTGRTAAVTA